MFKAHFSRKIISFVLFFLMAILPFGGISMEEAGEREAVRKDVVDYLKTSRLPPKDLLHRIQSEDFEGKHYKFHYVLQDYYLINIRDPQYPRYTPEGDAKVISVVATPTVRDVTLHWTTLDNPTPGHKTAFEMNFAFTKIERQ